MRTTNPNKMLAVLAIASASFAFATTSASTAQADPVNNYEFGYSGASDGSIVGAQLDVNGTIINATGAGWYDSTGFHDSTNTNYIVGSVNNVSYNDYFVFNLSGITGPITSATLLLSNPGDGFTGPTANYTNWDVSTPISTLIADNTGATGIYADLGTGTQYAATTVDGTTNGETVSVTLDAAALNAIASDEGSNFAIGGTFSAASVANTPLPASFWMLATVLAGAFGFNATRQRKAA